MHTASFAPLRSEVRRQSIAVSPPPSTATRFPRTSISGKSTSGESTFLRIRNGSAACTPARSSPGTPAAFGACAPTPRNTASKSCRSRASETSQPTFTPSRNFTPRRTSNSTRRSTMCFSSLNAGMPFTSSPPGIIIASNTVTS